MRNRFLIQNDVIWQIVNVEKEGKWSKPIIEEIPGIWDYMNIFNSHISCNLKGIHNDPKVYIYFELIKTSSS